MYPLNSLRPSEILHKRQKVSEIKHNEVNVLSHSFRTIYLQRKYFKVFTSQFYKKQQWEVEFNN